MLQHTEGPWTVRVDKETLPTPFCHIDGPDGQSIAFLSLNPNEVEGNATIMAAGWDLLQALREMVKWHGKRGGSADDLLPADVQPDEVAAAMRAIAKAEGRT